MFKSKDNDVIKKTSSFTTTTTDTYTLELSGAKTSMNYITKISDIVIDSANQSNTNMSIVNQISGVFVSLFSDTVRLANLNNTCENYISEVEEIADMNNVKSKDVYNQFVNNKYRKMFVDIGLKTMMPIMTNIIIKEITKNNKETPLTIALKGVNVPRLVGFGLSEIIDKHLVKNDIKKFEKSGEEGKKIGTLYYANKLGDTQYSKDSKFIAKGKIIGSLIDASIIGTLGYIGQKNYLKNKTIPDLLVVIGETKDKASPAKSKTSSTNNIKNNKK